MKTKAIKILNGIIPLLCGMAISMSIKQHNTISYVIAGIVGLLFVIFFVKSILE